MWRKFAKFSRPEILIDFRKGVGGGGMREREREKHQFAVSFFMHSLVASCMCPDQSEPADPAYGDDALTY